MQRVNNSEPNFVHVFVDTENNLDGSTPNDYCITEAHAEIQDLFGRIQFQNGPIKETGVNGCQIDDVLQIIVNRMRYFQCGDYACRENEVALKYLELAAQQLKQRTENRTIRGVKGQNKA